MNIIPIISELFSQLQQNYNLFNQQIREQINGNSDFSDIMDTADKIKILFVVLKREINKCKVIF